MLYLPLFQRSHASPALWTLASLYKASIHSIRSQTTLDRRPGEKNIVRIATGTSISTNMTIMTPPASPSRTTGDRPKHPPSIKDAHKYAKMPYRRMRSPHCRDSRPLDIINSATNRR